MRMHVPDSDSSEADVARRRRSQHLRPTGIAGLDARSAQLDAEEAKDRPRSLAADFGIEDHHEPEEADFSVVVEDDRALPRAQQDRDEAEGGTDTSGAGTVEDIDHPALAKALATARMGDEGPAVEMPDVLDEDEPVAGAGEPDPEDGEFGLLGGDGEGEREAGVEDAYDGHDGESLFTETILEEIAEDAGDEDAGPTKHVKVVRLFVRESLVGPVIDVERALKSFLIEWASHSTELVGGQDLELKIEPCRLRDLTDAEKAEKLNLLATAPPEPSKVDRARHALAWGLHLHRTGKKLLIDPRIQTQRPGKLGVVQEAKSDNAEEQKLIRRRRDAMAQKLHSKQLTEVAIYARVTGPLEDAQQLDWQLTEAVRETFPLDARVIEEGRARWEEVDPADYDAAHAFPPDDPEDGVVLSEEELRSLGIWPDSTINVPGAKVLHGVVRTLNADLKEVADPLHPQEDGEDLIPIGIISPDSIDERIVALQNRTTDQGVYITGQSGSGKSVAVIRAVLGTSKIKRQFVSIDPQGETAELLLQTLAAHDPEALDNVVYLSLGDDGDAEDLENSWSLAFNPLDVGTQSLNAALKHAGTVNEITETKLGINSKELKRAFRFLQEVYKAFVNVNMQIEEPEGKLTLLHVAPFLRDQEFRDAVLDLCDVFEVHEMFGPSSVWAGWTEQMRAENAAPLTNRFNDLANGDFRWVFSSPTDHFDIVDLVREGKSVIINLGNFSGNDGEFATFIASYLFGQLVSRIKEYGYDSITDTGEGVALFVDEAPKILRGEYKIIETLSQNRKLRLALWLLSQSTNLWEPEIRNGLFDNIATVLCFSQGDLAEAKRMAAIIDGSQKARVSGGDIQGLDPFYAYGKTIVRGEGAQTKAVFSLKGMKPLEIPPGTTFEAVEAVKERSRQLICNRKSDIAPRLETVPGYERDDGELVPPRRAMTLLALEAMKRALVRKESRAEAGLGQGGPSSVVLATTSPTTQASPPAKVPQADLEQLRGYTTEPGPRPPVPSAPDASAGTDGADWLDDGPDHDMVEAA